MPSDRSPLHLLLPIHVDDGATATNSKSLYAYIIIFLNQHFQVKDLGPIRLFLGVTVCYDLYFACLKSLSLKTYLPPTI